MLPRVCWAGFVVLVVVVSNIHDLRRNGDIPTEMHVKLFSCCMEKHVVWPCWGGCGVFDAHSYI